MLERGLGDGVECCLSRLQCVFQSLEQEMGFLEFRDGYLEAFWPWPLAVSSLHSSCLLRL